MALQHVEAVQTPQEYGGCEGAEGLPHQCVDKPGHGRLPLPSKFPRSSASISNRGELFYIGQFYLFNEFILFTLP